MATIVSGGEEKWFALGGATSTNQSSSSVEEWVEESYTWKAADNLVEMRSRFGAATVPRQLICQTQIDQTFSEINVVIDTIPPIKPCRDIFYLTLRENGTYVRYGCNILVQAGYGIQDNFWSNWGWCVSFVLICTKYSTEAGFEPATSRTCTGHSAHI